MKERILLVGATSGIGYQIADTLIKAGYEVVLVGRNVQKLQKMASSLKLSHDYIFEFDNENIDDVKSLFSNIVDSIGKLNSMIFCAGFHEVKPLRVAKPSDFSRAFKLNTESAFVFSKFFSSSLYSSGESRSIVYIASIASIVGEPGLIGYSAAKAGLVAGARCMAIELANKRIRVNCVSPGWVNTEHADLVKQKLGDERVAEIRNSYPLGFGEPQYIADACEFLISKKSQWITGQNLVVDGGRTIV
jgi:NAD(P)-dependent dehydrogenase (short-subunit alcohol dehydrogenase family)